MLTTVLYLFLGLQPNHRLSQLKDPWAGRQLFSQAADGSLRMYHHGPGTARHTDHLPQKGRLFAADEQEPFIRTELKPSL